MEKGPRSCWALCRASPWKMLGEHLRVKGMTIRTQHLTPVVTENPLVKPPKRTSSPIVFSRLGGHLNEPGRVTEHSDPRLTV